MQNPQKSKLLLIRQKLSLSDGETLVQTDIKTITHEKNYFSLNEITKISKWKYNKYGQSESRNSDTYTDLKWEIVVSIKIYPINDGWTCDNLLIIQIEFSSSIKVSDQNMKYFTKTFN